MLEAGGKVCQRLSMRPTHVVADASLGAERLQMAVGERKGEKGRAAVAGSGVKVCRLQWLITSLEMQTRIQEQGFLW